MQLGNWTRLCQLESIIVQIQVLYVPHRKQCVKRQVPEPKVGVHIDEHSAAIWYVADDCHDSEDVVADMNRCDG